MKAAIKYKFFKVEGDEDSRDVVRDGQNIGRIHRTWTRLGGWGWSHRIIGQAHRSMTDAAIDMERRAAR
jgi:hypothetical protein